MKSSKVIAAVLILMLSAAFAMSGDGGQQPVEQEKVSEEVQVQNEQVQQTEQLVLSKPTEGSGQAEKSGERVTVKDRFGIDTGMTKEELDEFKAQYIKRAEELGLFRSSKYGYDTYFDWKVNLTKRKELEAMNVDIKDIGKQNYHQSHYENAVYSDVVLIGEIYDLVYVEDQPFYKSVFKVKVKDVLKGIELIKNEFGNKISILSKNGKTFYSSDTTEMKVGESRLFFLSYKLGSEDKFASRSLSERIIKDGKLYDREGKRLIGNLDDEIIKIIKIIEINDSKNFYKRSYKVEE
jgi:hypothetical protein